MNAQENFQNVSDTLLDMGYTEVKVPELVRGARKAFRGGALCTRHYVGVKADGSWFMRFSSVLPHDSVRSECQGESADSLEALYPLWGE